MMETRNVGVDFLRVVSAYMIFLIHIICNGGVIGTAEIGTVRFVALEVLDVIVFCGVNCYGLISGYVGIDSKWRLSSIIVLWIEVVFYSVIFNIIYIAIHPTISSYKFWIKAFSPITQGTYWYFTAYACLFFIKPLIDCGINRIGRTSLRIIIVILVCFLSLSQTVYGTDVFNINEGYSAWWLLLCYLIGGYIKKYDIKIPKKVCVLGFCFCCLLTILFNFIEISIYEYQNIDVGDCLYWRYMWPTILFQAIFLLELFLTCHVKILAYSKIILWLAPATFCTYIMQCHSLVWNLQSGHMIFLNSYPVVIEIILILAIGIAAFCGFATVDNIRRRIFKKIGLYDAVKRIDKLVEMEK